MLASDKVPPSPGKVAWQCVRCAHLEETQSKPKTKCGECGCSMWNEIDLSWGEAFASMDRPSDESTAHFKKKLENCLNYSVSPRNPLQRWNHKLKLKKFVSKEAEYVKVEEKCSQCSLLYSLRTIPLTRVDKLKAALSKDELRELKIELPD